VLVDGVAVGRRLTVVMHTRFEMSWSFYRMVGGPLPACYTAAYGIHFVL